MRGKPLVSMLLLCHAIAALAERPDVLLTSSIRHASNVSNAARGHDIENDQQLTWEVRGDWRRALSDDSELAWHGGLGLEHFHEYDALSNAELAGGLEWRMRTGIGYRAPVIRLSARVAGRLYNDSDIRDGLSARLGAGLGSRITDRLMARAGYRFELRRAAEDEVFDLENHRLFVNLDLRATPRVALYATLSGVIGEVVSTAVPEAGLVAAASAISRRPDRVFGPGVPVIESGPGPGPSPGPGPGPGPSPGPGPGFLPGDRFAYRIDADTLVVDGGVSIALADSTSLDVGAGIFRSYVDGARDYDGFSVSLTLLHRMGH